MSKARANILFVCTGNICRSPMAAYLFAKRAGPDFHWQPSSAGLGAIDGLPASQAAVSVMRDQGVDLEPHLSRALTRDLVERAAIIVAMTAAQAAEVRRRYPSARDRVHLLGSFSAARPGLDIQDPVGCTRETYRRTLEDISGCMDNLIAFLKSCRASEHQLQ